MSAKAEGRATNVANTVEMLRLMRHSADLLAANDPTGDYQTLISEVSVSDGFGVAARLAALRAAMATAESMLRMVAAAMDDDVPSSVPAAVSQ